MIARISAPIMDSNDSRMICPYPSQAVLRSDGTICWAIASISPMASPKTLPSRFAVTVT